MILIDNINLLKRVTQLFGLTPFFSEKGRSTVHALLLAIQFIYVCILSIPCLFQCFRIYLISSVERKPDLSEFVSLLEVSFLSLTAFVAWFCSLVFYNDLLIINSTFNEVQELFSLLGVNVLCGRIKIIKVLQLIFFIFVVVTLNILEYFENGYNLGYMIALPITMAEFYQFVNFIICLNYCFISINKYLCNYAKSVIHLKDTVFTDNRKNHNNLTANKLYAGTYSKWKSSNHNIIFVKSHLPSTDEIKLAREIHRFLYVLSKAINNFFSIQILILLFSKIISITIVLYYVLSSTKLDDLDLRHSDYWIPRLNKVILCISNFLQLIAIAYVCSKTCEEANFTGVLVHGALNSDDHREVQNELQVFSQQILHQKIVFTAAGFVVLDFTLINAVIGAVTTYLVILIQFQMST